MSSYLPPSHCPHFEQALAPFLVDEGLPFANVLPAQEVAQAFADEGVTFGALARAIFTPALTLWAFLSQVLDKEKSCRAAVLRVAALLIARGQQPCAEDTAAYCRARAQLPVAVLRRLAYQSCDHLEQQVPADWLWQGRHVKLIDGTTVTAPDTPENQKAYPQSPSQKPGLGFPIIRLVVFLSLATAALGGMALAPYCGKETGETALARELLELLQVGDVLLGDRYYCTYWLVAQALGRGADVVFRMHHRRGYDFRRGRRLGPCDHVVSWHKPERPEWMDKDSYAAWPQTLTLRELHVAVTTPGFRVSELVIVTTLTDAAAYTKEALADLYHKRWHVELDLRAIKQALHMDQLRCRTPGMIQRELWAHVLGYNLVRKVSAQAAQTQGVHPRDVSFSATKQALNAAWSQLSQAQAAERVRQGGALLGVLGTEPVGPRPDRCEPRAVKRRPKEYDRLMEPRAKARARLYKRQKGRRAV